MPLIVFVVKMPDSQSGKQGSISEASDYQAKQAVISSCPALGAAKIKRQRREDKHHRKNAGLTEVAGVKPSHSPTTYTGYETTFTFYLIYDGRLQNVIKYCIKVRKAGLTGKEANKSAKV